MQVEAFCQVPDPSQDCTVSPTHCFAPGLHVPEHAPPLHTLVQAVPSTHLPFGSQVSGTSFEHCLVPGEQTPLHAPLTHA
jgi:hypothetical protein